LTVQRGNGPPDPFLIRFTILDGAVHPLDLAVCPWMLHLGEAMLDAILPTAHIEHVCDVSSRGPIGVARWKGELDAVVGKNGMDPIGYSLDQGHEEG
jgi:hypothetical protein